MEKVARIVLTVTLLTYSSFLWSGNGMGIPNINAYEYTDYGASIQNWDIAQDNLGILYFANNDGMLIFNGLTWNLHPLPSKTIMRSIEIAPTGFIYCGGQNDFGRFVPDAVGNWKFHSLRDSIPALHRDFEDVWDMCIVDQNIYFRSSGRIYRYSDEGSIVYSTYDFQFLDIVEGVPIVQSVDGALYRFVGTEFQKIDGSELLKGSLVIDIAKQGNQRYLLVTENHGLFEYRNGQLMAGNSKWNNFLKENKVTSMTALYNGDLAIGTSFSGVIVIDKSFDLRYHLNSENGILNNNVGCMLSSKDQNLWLSVEKGINLVQINSPFNYLHPDGELDGIGYTARVHDDKIYFGTNNGLYSADWPNSNKDIEGFEKYNIIAGTKGQVWGLDQVNGSLVLSHQNGAFRIDGETADHFYDRDGAWLMKPIANADGTFIVGTYSNVNLFRQAESDFIYEKPLSQMRESSRFIEQDDHGNIWVAHPYRGIYRLSPIENEDENYHFELYGPEQGLPSHLHNHVFKIKDKVIFCAEKGIYEFNNKENRFQPYTPLNELFGSDTKIRRLFEDGNDNIWYITENKAGLLTIEDRGLERRIHNREFPRLKEMLNAGWEYIYPYDNENVFIASSEGFVHYDPSREVVTDSNLQILFTEIKTIEKHDSLLFSGLSFDGHQITNKQLEDWKIIQPARNQTLQFNYSAIAYDERELRYRSRLVGFDTDWSPWTDKNINEYTRLKPGKYTFLIEARTINSNKLGRTEYRFEILRPWYGSTLARLIYAAIFLTGFILFLLNNRRKIVRLEDEVEQTASKSKSEIKRLENEKMEVQLEHKKRELITSSMHLIHKNETMKEILEKLQSIKKECADDLTGRKLSKLIHVVDLDTDLDEHWEDLMYHFNEVHKDFFTNLKDKHSTLTNKDLKLCAYLRMNLSTKDIALLSNVSHRGIDASRYRLRKKLGVTGEVNLTEFLMSY
ncbi:MAG: hypothetical protein GY751_16060 [Bacteroidetes bacterium]|nr:hypothetical protein [Bacteroidota bacterium]